MLDLVQRIHVGPFLQFERVNTFYAASSSESLLIGKLKYVFG